MLNHGLRISLMLLLIPAMAYAADSIPSFDITYRHTKFHPLELVVPAHTAFNLVVKNKDREDMAFDGVGLGHTKVLGPGEEETIMIAPLKPGTYEYDNALIDFTKGFITAK